MNAYSAWQNYPLDDKFPKIAKCSCQFRINTLYRCSLYRRASYMVSIHTAILFLKNRYSIHLNLGSTKKIIGRLIQKPSILSILPSLLRALTNSRLFSPYSPAISKLLSNERNRDIGIFIICIRSKNLINLNLIHHFYRPQFSLNLSRQ